jgi:hypothetical protein
MGLAPNYARDMLGGMLLTGVGVGLTLPTFMAAGASSLPPHSFATGSAALNMLRQIGLAIGVAVLIAILGNPGSPGQILHVYEVASLVIAAIAIAAGLLGLPLLREREPPAGATVPKASRPALAGASEST